MKRKKYRYRIGDYSYDIIKGMIETINLNCDDNKESRIPMMYGNDDFGWYIECLHKKDEPRIEKYLNSIYGLAWQTKFKGL